LSARFGFASACRHVQAWRLSLLSTLLPFVPRFRLLLFRSSPVAREELLPLVVLSTSMATFRDDLLKSRRLEGGGVPTIGARKGAAC
jgi:hypothetical protein